MSKICVIFPGRVAVECLKRKSGGGTLFKTAMGGVADLGVFTEHTNDVAALPSDELEEERLYLDVAGKSTRMH